MAFKFFGLRSAASINMVERTLILSFVKLSLARSALSITTVPFIVGYLLPTLPATSIALTKLASLILPFAVNAPLFKLALTLTLVYL